MKKYSKALLLIISAAIISSCADVENVDECVKSIQYGFWYGLWHGCIAPVSFIASLFFDDVAVYAINNTGGWYDFGFILGIGGLKVTTNKIILRK